jgi:ribose-phosphate pyrophosphokinase
VTLTLFAGSGSPALAAATAERLGITPGACDIQAFPDGELHVEIQDSVRGHDVYLLQATGPPAERHLLELLLLGDACRRAGAARVSAVIPYFAYARQDRRATGREAIGARVVADILGTRDFARIIAVDLHSPALEGFLAPPLEHLSAVPVLAEALRRDLPADGSWSRRTRARADSPARRCAGTPGGGGAEGAAQRLGGGGTERHGDVSARARDRG